MQDATKCLMGSVGQSGYEADDYAGDPATFLAGLAVRLDNAGALSLDSGDGRWLGISRGRSLSNTEKCSIIRTGREVPVLVERQPARGTITISSYANLVSGTPDVITVGATAFTAQAGAATPGDATFQAATNNDDTATSLAAQINAHATAGALVVATVASNVVTLTAKSNTTAADTIVLTYTDNDTNVGATVSGATLSGGDPDFDAVREEICELIKDSVPAGIVTQGDQVQSITLSNDQSFDFKFNLPTRITTLLRLTITVSDNNQYAILSDSDVAELLLENLTARYRLGLDFEPQRYFSILDAPWAASVLLEWSINDGADYYSTVNDLEYNELMEVALADIEVVTA